MQTYNNIVIILNKGDIQIQIFVFNLTYTVICNTSLGHKDFKIFFIIKLSL